MDSRLQGKRILIVEDNYLLAADVRCALEEQGAIIAGPVADVDSALALIASGELDAAVLDIELHEENSFPIADELMHKNIPFVFASGMSREDIPKRFNGFHLVAKPAEGSLLRACLVRLTRFQRLGIVALRHKSAKPLQLLSIAKTTAEHSKHLTTEFLAPFRVSDEPGFSDDSRADASNHCNLFGRIALL